MTHPLIDRLTSEFGWPRLADATALAAHLDRPGFHCIFVPGDPARNLETADVAVILPELRLAFQGRFDCAIAAPALEDTVKDAAGIHKTPSLVFFQGAAMIGALPRVRDWDDYMTRIPQILATQAAA